MISASIRGRLGREPEPRQTERGGRMVLCSLIVEVNRHGADRDVEWIKIGAFGAPAEALLRLHKGDQVTATGKLTRRRFTARDGSERTAWVVNADSIAGPRP